MQTYLEKINLQLKELGLDQKISNDILFLNKYPNTEEAKDGLYNRVIFIDKIFDKYCRVYINEASDFTELSIDIINQRCIQINIPLLASDYYQFAAQFSASFGIVYVHSIYQLISSFKQNLFLSCNNKIWDVHGVVPEELVMMGNRSTEVINFVSGLEKLAYTHATLIIAVTGEMIKHLQNKYSDLNQLSKKFIKLPIISTLIAPNGTVLSPLEKNKPVVIYSGGVQVWQQVHKMLEFVHLNTHRFSFIFLVTDVDLIRKKYQELYACDFPDMLKSVSPEEVSSYYKVAKYGLLLRDDNVVNQVACPTKLIEYISYGLIPIFASDQIGDFKTLGLKYYEYFRTDDLTSSEEELFIEQNYNVLMQLVDSSQVGSEELQRWICSLDSCSNENDFSGFKFKILWLLDTFNNQIKNEINFQDLRHQHNQKLSEVYNSHSWRITKPLRKIVKLIKIK